jgi:hypothetical protein
MKKLLIGALLGAAAFTVPSMANAAQTIVISGPSGTFGDDEVVCGAGEATPCSFTRTFNFTTQAGFELVNATISSIASSAMTNLDFTRVTLNDVSFDTVRTGTTEFRELVSQALNPVGSNNTLLVTGTTGGNAAFSGTLSFAAVPEPTTWAMMLIGFGAVGYSMRKRPSRRLQMA